jgi:hypothetical protein
VIGDESQLVPLDAVTLAARIAEVLSSSAVANSFRQRGQTVVAKRYAWVDVCAEYERLLSGLAVARERDAGAADAGRRHRRGRIVAVVGPDGAGKSTLTSQLRDAVAARPGADATTVNFRSRYLDALLGRMKGSQRHNSAEPQSTPPRNAAMATLKAIAIWSDLVVSALVWRRSRRTVTFVERYAYDLLVDPARLGIVRAPRRLREGAVRLTPAPDAIVMCTAPAAVLHSRKPELPESEVARQYSSWARIRSRLDVPYFDIDTTRPVDAERLAERLLAALER